jgi:hypothetical protein
MDGRGSADASSQARATSRAASDNVCLSTAWGCLLQSCVTLEDVIASTDSISGGLSCLGQGISLVQEKFLPLPYLTAGSLTIIREGYTMRDSGILPINFTISDNAKLEIRNLRDFWNAKSLDPAAVAVIAWGLFQNTSGERRENVLVTFYGQSQLSEIADGFTTQDHYPKFEGKVIDHMAERGFFLRGP